MRYRITIPLAGLLLISSLAPARAEGRWSLGLFAGESVSQHHGAALDARALAMVDPLLGLGIETGMAYMSEESREPPSLVYPAEPNGGNGAASQLSSLTDGITRNRGYYLGPAMRVGQSVYAIVSTGLYEFSDNAGQFTGTRWGYSAGIGLAGRRHFQPSAELRWRASQDASHSTTAIMFTVGLNIQTGR